jgi:hypothetical protein
MKRIEWRGQAAWIVAIVLIVTGESTWAHQAADASKSSDKSPATAVPVAAPPRVSGTRPAGAAPAAFNPGAAPVSAKKFHGRLPAYYTQVVDDKQRQEIYAIQEQYHAKISALKAQLEAVTNERDDRIAAVLTAQQRKKIDSLRAAGKQKREEQKEQ